MTYAIAAAGTGGHVYPGFAVGEALLDAGAAHADILFIGGDRLEATVFPDAGFPFEAVEIRGLDRRAVRSNLGLPAVIRRARHRIDALFDRYGTRVAIGFGNYITIPVAIAARRRRLPLFVHEQNAHPGLANRFASRRATRSFVSFPDTPQLHRAEYTGNPLRSIFWTFDRERLRGPSLQYFGLGSDRVTVGAFGGSLGARVINDAVSEMLSTWTGPEIQVVHLVGRNGAEMITGRRASAPDGGRRSPDVRWVMKTFEDRMDFFFAACDLVIARAGGSIAEVLATATPSVLVPGGFGSGGHQAANARYAAAAGAAVVVEEPDVGGLADIVREIAADPDRRIRMAASARQIARPDAAQVIAQRLMEAAHG